MRSQELSIARKERASEPESGGEIGKRTNALFPGASPLSPCSDSEAKRPVFFLSLSVYCCSRAQERERGMSACIFLLLAPLRTDLLCFAFEPREPFSSPARGTFPSSLGRRLGPGTTGEEEREQGRSLSRAIQVPTCSPLFHRCQCTLGVLPALSARVGMGLGKMRQGFLSPYPLVFLVLARTAQRRREQKACSMFQNVSLDRSRREHETTRELLSNPFKPWDGRVVSNGHQKTLFVSSWEANCTEML